MVCRDRYILISLNFGYILLDIHMVSQTTEWRLLYIGISIIKYVNIILLLLTITYLLLQQSRFYCSGFFLTSNNYMRLIKHLYHWIHTADVVKVVYSRLAAEIETWNTWGCCHGGIPLVDHQWSWTVNSHPFATEHKLINMNQDSEFIVNSTVICNIKLSPLHLESEWNEVGLESRV